VTDYGTDLNFDGLDLADDGGTVSGVDLLAQAIQIRLSTPRGSVIDAPDDGIDLVDYLSRDMTSGDVANLSGVIESEILKDERFSSAKATVDASKLRSASELSIALAVQSGAGPFQLVLGVSDAGVAILGGA
jgi:phage baseplate assembly protein W